MGILVNVRPDECDEFYHCSVCGTFICNFADIVYERSVYSVFVEFEKIINYSINEEDIHCLKCNNILGHVSDGKYFLLISKLK